MGSQEHRRHSRWILRVQEWDEPRAPYPNLWHEGMPRHVLAYDTVVTRLRLGDLVAIYYPTSQRHPERSRKFLGLCRVAALRWADDRRYGWIDFEVAHRFEPPLHLGRAPRRVVLCCDPGWPEGDVALFRAVYEAARAAGWQPAPEDEWPAAKAEEPRTAGPAGAREEPQPQAVPRSALAAALEPGAECFAGAAISDDRRDPRNGTWLAVIARAEGGLELVRLEPTSRSGLHTLLRDPDGSLLRARAIGLAFPFGFPLAFAERLLGGVFPDDGWWALARRMERLPLPEYLMAVQEFRERHGESKRYTDECAGTPSPLVRNGPDFASLAYHGIKLIAEERSRYAVRPFERAQGKPLLEVSPWALRRRLGDEQAGPEQQLEALARHERHALAVPDALARACAAHAAALDAILAAWAAARASLSGEADRTPEELAPDAAERIAREGWIYGLELPGIS